MPIFISAKSISIHRFKILMKICIFIFINDPVINSDCTGIPLTYTTAIFQKVWHKSTFLLVRIEYTCGQLCMFIQGIPVEIQTATSWGLISCSIMALLPLPSPSIILPPLSCHCVLILTRKNMACITKVLFLFHFLKNYVI